MSWRDPFPKAEVGKNSEGIPRDGPNAVSVAFGSWKECTRLVGQMPNVTTMSQKLTKPIMLLPLRSNNHTDHLEGTHPRYNLIVVGPVAVDVNRVPFGLTRRQHVLQSLFPEYWYLAVAL